MRISGLFYRVLVCLAIFSAYAFAQTVAVAHIIYEEGNVLYYADNESNFVYKSLEKGKETSVAEVIGAKKAKDTIKKCIDCYITDFQMA